MPAGEDRACESCHGCGGAAITLRRLRQDIMVRTDSPDMTEAADSTEPIESKEAAEPTEPIDRTEPTEPTDKIDPLQPMQRIEPSDRIDHFDVPAPSATPWILPPSGRTAQRTR